MAAVQPAGPGADDHDLVGLVGMACVPWGCRYPTPWESAYSAGPLGLFGVAGVFEIVAQEAEHGRPDEVIACRSSPLSETIWRGHRTRSAERVEHELLTSEPDAEVRASARDDVHLCSRPPAVSRSGTKNRSPGRLLAARLVVWVDAQSSM